MNEGTFRAKRVAAGISGDIVCRKAGIDRARLSRLERGIVTAAPDEMARLNAVLDELIAAKQELVAHAAVIGWPGVVA